MKKCLIIFFSAACAVLGCEDAPKHTYTIVTIDAVDALRDASLELRVKSTRVDKTFPYASPVGWPQTLTLEPSSDADENYEVTAEARSESDDVLARAIFRSGYVVHETRYLRVLLENGCTEAPAHEIEARDLPRDMGLTRADVRSCAEREEAGKEKGSPSANDDNTREDTDAGASGATEKSQMPPMSQAGSSGQADCPRGHRREAGGKCVVVDECQESSPCGQHGSCVELTDGYECNCAGGYVFGSGTCTDQDECTENKGGCEYRCRNDLGAFHCECGDAGILRPDGRSCWRWSEPLPVDSGNTGDATNPRVGVGADGQGVVLWMQANGTDDVHMRANRYRGGGWQTAERIGNSGCEPLLLVAADSSATAFWREGSSLQFNLFSTTGWGSQVQTAMEGGNTKQIWTYTAGANAAGTGWFAYWTQMIGHGGGGSMSSKRLPLAADGGSAPEGFPAVGDGSTVNHIDVVVDEGGNALTALLQGGNAVASYFDKKTGSWTEVTQLNAQMQFDVQAPRAAIMQHEIHSSGPSVYYSQNAVVWGRDAEDGRGTWARWGTAGSWNPEVKLGDAAAAKDTLRVGMTGADHVVAVWQGSTSGIWLAEFDAVMSGVGDLQAAHYIDSVPNATGSEPALAVLPDGRAIIVWTSDDGEHKQIRAKHFVPRNGWGKDIQLSRPDAQPANAPQIALAPNGNAIAVWQEADESRHHIVASTFE